MESYSFRLTQLIQKKYYNFIATDMKSFGYNLFSKWLYIRCSYHMPYVSHISAKKIRGMILKRNFEIFKRSLSHF